MKDTTFTDLLDSYLDAKSELARGNDEALIENRDNAKDKLNEFVRKITTIRIDPSWNP